MYYNGMKNVPLGFIYEGTTYVPLRFVAENLGLEVGYDGKKNTIWVGSQPSDKETGNLPAGDMKTGVSQNDKAVEAYLGMTRGQLVQVLGEPARVDPGPYGFDWWIYNQDYAHYLQVGVQGDRVVAFYTNSRQWSIDGIKLGTERDTVVRKLQLTGKVQASYDDISYTFSLPAQTFKQRALRIDGQVVTEFFFDTHDGEKLTAVQVTDLTTFLQSDFNYSVNISYPSNKKLPDKPKLTPDQQEAMERAYERQVFDLANSARVQRGLPALEWNEEAAAVARAHSRDMLHTNFFSHHSPNTGSMGDRLQKAGINYQAAGENIAFGQSDAINAHEGWMNSSGHRQNILNPDFKTLGVGVAGKYYTQNFVT
ncbi:MAG TPA: hypothetical protein GXX34_09895 [Clostridia bacterium]|nr:hypothetical protein [Clostridia bacterium]